MTVTDGAAGSRRAERLSKWAGPLTVAAPFVASGVACAALGITEAKAYYGEDGPVEIGTAVVLPLTAVLYVMWMSRLGLRSLVPPFMLLLMTARELDGDKWFTEKTLLSTGYYFDNPGVPYSERIVVGAVVAAIGIIILRFLWNNRFGILAAVGACQPYCVSLLLAFGLMGASQIMDAASRTYLWLVGTRMPTLVSNFTGIMEETAELAMALAFLMALLQLRFDTERNALPVSGARGRGTSLNQNGDG